MAIFDHAHPNIIESTFRFPEFIPACKKSVNSIYSFLRYSQFSVIRLYWPHPFLTMLNQTIFNQHLIFENLYRHTKNEAVSSIYSGEVVDLKILESDCMRPIWPISLRNNILPKYGICVGTQQ